ncbi:hypothetical protein L218DRAFT_871052 [Marasmius fiardii PR-910]|nr:hypothetical protein L218DRAFT_871052 [Marasmius fiardii PR-910]
MIAGIKVFEKRIDKNNAETKARREKERRAKLIKEYRRKVATKKLKDRLFELVETAERGEKLDVPEPSSTEVAAWTSYDANWKAILDGNLEKLISLDVFPCPTLKAKKIALEDYEEFLISPVRTGYEKLNFYERAAKEQELWDEEHIAEKVLPFVEEESRERVVRGAGAIRGYLERIIAKFNACEW